MMRISIVGATGGTGQELTRQALALGHTVKVLVRSPEKVTTAHERLEVIKVDLLKDSVKGLAEKLENTDVVLSALGVSNSLGITHLYSAGTQKLLNAMQLAHIKRLMIVSSVGTDPSGNEPWWYLWLVRRLLVNHYVDMARMEQLVMDTTDLDWILIRASRLTNGKKTGFYRVEPRYAPKGGLHISRADLADFMLKQLEQATYVRQTPALAY